MAFTRYTGVVILAMLLGYVTSRPGLQCSYDASSIKLNSLNPVSQRLWKNGRWVDNHDIRESFGGEFSSGSSFGEE